MTDLAKLAEGRIAFVDSECAVIGLLILRAPF